MGGCAFLIWGQVDEKLLAPVQLKRTLWDRLLRRSGVKGPKIIELPNGSRLIELSADGLEGMKKDFRAFLAERIPRPWPSTKVFLDYLDMDIVTVHVRGEQEQGGAAKWYVQFAFSGCAGTAEVSAELGTHWAQAWYSQRREAIERNHLQPFGFVPDELQTDLQTRRSFLPVGDLGYALYVGKGHTDSELFQPEHSFELDDAMGDMAVRSGESADQYPLLVLKGLEERFSTLMSDSACRCQLCMPDFDPSSVVGPL